VAHCTVSHVTASPCRRRCK